MRFTNNTKISFLTICSAEEAPTQENKEDYQRGRVSFDCKWWTLMWSYYWHTCQMSSQRLRARAELTTEWAFTQNSSTVRPPWESYSVIITLWRSSFITSGCEFSRFQIRFGYLQRRGYKYTRINISNAKVYCIFVAVGLSAAFATSTLHGTNVNKSEEWSYSTAVPGLNWRNLEKQNHLSRTDTCTHSAGCQQEMCKGSRGRKELAHVDKLSTTVGMGIFGNFTIRFSVLKSCFNPKYQNMKYQHCHRNKKVQN